MKKGTVINISSLDATETYNELNKKDRIAAETQADIKVKEFIEKYN